MVADEKYKMALEAIQSFFSLKVNIVAECYRFRQCGQCTDETTDQYVAALKELITTCEFGTMEEEMIWDQLTEKTNSPRIRERLLLEVPLTLTKAMMIARQIETAVVGAKAMCTGAVDSTVHTVQSKGPQQHGKFKKGQHKLYSPTQATQAPPPTDLSKLRSFLGLTSWYSKFIPDYAAVAEPLQALLCGSDLFTWTPEAQRSFKTVKELIVNSPALSLFNPELPTVVTTDVSDYGLGAVLTQMHHDDSERTVAFASSTLTQAERNYSTVEKEALGCVWATEKWRTYLWGRHFTLRTDHSPLTMLLASKGQGRAGMRIARWSSRLLSFNYDIQYKPSRENVTADCLSQLPLPSSEPSLVDDIEMALTSALSAYYCG
ncbi:hypothetical protein LDENG_00139450 [Lucifuga dentata]|nr:hypothetical protein LDENG_00139450 [Lucifuga dentata]